MSNKRLEWFQDYRANNLQEFFTFPYMDRLILISQEPNGIKVTHFISKNYCVMRGVLSSEDLKEVIRLNCSEDPESKLLACEIFLAKEKEFVKSNKSDPDYERET